MWLRFRFVFLRLFAWCLGLHRWLPPRQIVWAKSEGAAIQVNWLAAVPAVQGECRCENCTRRAFEAQMSKAQAGYQIKPHELN